jgi:hypothetical protein
VKVLLSEFNPAVEYVLPAIFYVRIDMEHRYMDPICGTTLGIVRARAPGHYMPLNDRLIPKYVIQYTFNINMNSTIFHYIFHCTHNYYTAQ